MIDDGKLPGDLSRLTEMLQEANRLAQSLNIPDLLAARHVGEDPEIASTSHRVVASPAPQQSKPAMRMIRPPLPDPRLIRRIIRLRQLRGRYFNAKLFADPAWDMLLDLTAARAEHRRVSVTSLCIASGVPPTTALRWISQMIDEGLFARVGDEADRRRAFIELTDRSAEMIARYFAEGGTEPHR